MYSKKFSNTVAYAKFVWEMTSSSLVGGYIVRVSHAVKTPHFTQDICNVRFDKKKCKINHIFIDARGYVVPPIQFCLLSNREGNLIPCMHMTVLLKVMLVMIMMTRWVSGGREECVTWHETMVLLRENIGV